MRRWGHHLLVAETFTNPARHRGTLYRATNWTTFAELTKGYARGNGSYTDPHGEKKQIWVKELRRDACRRLAATAPLPEAIHPKPKPLTAELAEMRSLYSHLETIPDFRRAQGLRHTIPLITTLLLLTQLYGKRGCLEAERVGRNLSQEELAAIGAWRNPKTGKYCPPGKSTIHRVLVDLSTEFLEDTFAAWTGQRQQPDEAPAGLAKAIMRP